MPNYFWRKLAILALPVALQILLQAFLGMADVAMVAGLGSDAVAAVGMVAKLHFLVLVFMIGVASAGAVLTAQHFGAKDLAKCQRTVAITLAVGVILSIPFMLVFSLGYYWLSFVNPDPKVVQLSVSYMFITTPVVLITQIVVVYESCLRSIGNTIVPLLIGALVAVLNILFNYVLIFGEWGFPVLGVQGAAWGTLIARVIQLIVFLLWIYGSCHIFAISVLSYRKAFTWRNIHPFVVFAAPVVLNHGIWGVGNAAYHIATGYAGTQALAVMGAMAPLESAFFSLFIGLASACSVMIGQSLGADRPSEAWHLHKRFDHLALALVLLFSLLLWLLRHYVVASLSRFDEQTSLLLLDTISIFCLVVAIKIMNMMRILGVLRAGGDNNFCLQVDAIVMWVFGLPIFLFGVWAGWSFLVLYALMALEDTLKFLPVKYRVSKRIWIKNLTHTAND